MWAFETWNEKDYQEHMEAKAEDHIRDIRTDAEISQLDSIEDAAPWLQVDWTSSDSVYEVFEPQN